MSKTSWSDRRLTALFNRYNRRFWKGKLPAYTVTADTSSRPLRENWRGLCVSKERVIYIDVAAHRGDREIRATLLHEMVHAAVACGQEEPDALAHGYCFWRETERLLKKGAAVTVAFPESPHLAFVADAVPSSFMLCRKAARKEERRRQKIARAGDPGKGRRGAPIRHGMMSARRLVGEFEDAALQMTWPQALLMVGGEYGLLESDGRPKDNWAARIIAEGKEAYARTRKFVRESKRVAG